MLSCYQYAARALHKFAHITGDGPFALVIKCTMQGRIHLFPSIYQAETAAAKPCGAMPCKLAHTVETLQPVMVPSAQVAGQFAEWD